MTHRELGDHTDALAVLMETPNPAQGRICGRTMADLALTGRDEIYERAARAGRLFVPFDAGGWPLDVRVGRHATGVGLNSPGCRPGRGVTIQSLPSLEDLRRDGLGRYLQPPR